MFFQIFKYNFKTILVEKSGLFWTLAFPILLSTLFGLAFANLHETNSFDSIPVAIVDSQNADATFLEVMAGTDLFDIQTTDEGEAKELLSHGKISGYITFDGETELTVQKSGLEETILKSFLDSYAQDVSTVTNIMTLNPQAMSKEFVERLMSEDSYTIERPVRESNDTTVIYFYALLAMNCIMTATYGCVSVVNIQANQSQIAARTNVAPTHKMKVFLASISAYYVCQIINILIILAYLILVLKVDFGASLGRVVLMCFVGSLTGITMGTSISALLKKSEGIKMAIVIGITMLGSFLAGLMSTDIKYIVDKGFPPAKYINPVSLITDGFYCLYYYDTYERFYMNLGILGGMAVLFCLITYSILRRQKYESI